MLDRCFPPIDIRPSTSAHRHLPIDIRPSALYPTIDVVACSNSMKGHNHGNQLTIADRTIADSMIVPECAYRPGSFSGLMTLYESNFIKLSHLIAEFDSFPEAHEVLAVSSSDEDCDLYLAVQRRRPYTTTLKLTYLFPLDEPEARQGSSFRIPTCGCTSITTPGWSRQDGPGFGSPRRCSAQRRLPGPGSLTGAGRTT